MKLRHPLLAEPSDCFLSFTVFFLLRWQSFLLRGCMQNPFSLLWTKLWIKLPTTSLLMSTLVVIQVDIGGHPPFPNGSKQFSGHFGNLLFLAGFHFRGHFEGLNEVFSRSRFSMIAEGMIEPPK
jgi:hypothetical protein